MISNCKTTTIFLLFFYSIFFELQAQDEQVSIKNKWKKHTIRLGISHYTGKGEEPSTGIAELDKAVKDIFVRSGLLVEYKFAISDLIRTSIRFKYGSTSSKASYSLALNATPTHVASTVTTDIEYNLIAWALLTGIDFHYFNRNNYSIYSGIGIGLQFIDLSARAKVKSSIVLVPTSSSSENDENAFAYQLKIIGAEYVGERFSGFFELGFSGNTFKDGKEKTGLMGKALDITIGAGYSF